MSKDSGTKPSIREIFDRMEYGSISEGKNLAENWISQHADQLGPFINGKLSPHLSDGSQNLSTGVKCLASLKLNKQLDYPASQSAASSAFSTWSVLEGHARAKIIYSIARQLQKHTTLICEVEAFSRGVQVSNAREFDVPALIRTFYYYAGWAQLKDSELSSWIPLGPIVAVTSNGAPLVSLALCIAPALASGNTITLLPHVSNCLSSLLLAQICSAAGVPPGVLNVVPLEHLMVDNCPAVSDITVKKIAVIGSRRLGQTILSSSEELNQSNLMLLNGCVPMIILDSADLDAAVDCAVDTWINQGQDPWALRLLIVQEAVYESFKSKLTVRIRSMQMGGAFDKMADASDYTVDISIAQRLQETLSLDPSSEVVQPSSTSSSKWAPTVIFSAAPPTMPVLGTADECPLLYVVGARSAKEAISIANHCGAGAAVSMWTESSAFAMEASLQLKAGTVWINSHGCLDACIPISGRNLSGFGCFLGEPGLMEFLQPRTDKKMSLMKVHISLSTSLMPVDPNTDLLDVDQTYKLFYGGGQKRPNSNTYRTLLDLSGKMIAMVPEANRKDVRNAVDAAVKAQPGWWKRGAHNRAQIIYNLAEKLQARRRHFASHLQGVYQNLDLEKCLNEVDECTKLLFHFAAICDKMVHSSGQISVNGMTVTVLREPLGVIAVVCTTGACNALADFITLLGAALAYGNTCVVAAHPDCPTPALELAQLLEAAEIPVGVVNILSGGTLALLPALCGHMEINAVWSVGYQEKVCKIMKEEAGKSNVKQTWFMEQVLNPLDYDYRRFFEMKASQSKAIWVPAIASFGN